MAREIEPTRHEQITRLAWLCAGDLSDEQIARLVRLAEHHAKAGPHRKAVIALIDKAIEIL